MDVWQQRTSFRSIVLVWFLPLMGPATQAWQSFVPVGLMPSPVWARYAATISFSYALGLLGTAFLVKRGLMLGATGPDAYYPGFVPGPGGYLQEKTILSSLGLKVREFPLDSAILVGGFLLGFLTHKNQLDFFNELRIMNNQPQFSQLWIQFAIVAIFIPIVVVSWIRRQKLGRA